LGTMGAAAAGALTGAGVAARGVAATGAGCGAGAVTGFISAIGAAIGAGAAGATTGAGVGTAARAGITRPLLSNSILPRTFKPGVLGASGTGAGAGSGAAAIGAGAAATTGCGATTGAGVGAATGAGAGAGAAATGAATGAGAGLATGAGAGFATAACACAFSSLWRRAWVWRWASCLSWAEAANSFSNRLTCSPVSLVVGLFSTAIPFRERASTARSMPMFRSLAACKSRFGVASAILISRERIRSGCKGKD
jgi:hypothetical protein